MKILIIGNFHHKNKIGLKLILEHLKWQYKFGNEKNINNFNIIYSPSKPINTQKYPRKKFIFGPHFSVFPNNKLKQINNINKNSVYIQPSLWPIAFWENYDFYNKFQQSNICIPFKPFPFPVDTERFCPTNTLHEHVFVYFKQRNPKELSFIQEYFNTKKIEYRVFNYTQRYNEDDYLNYIKKSKYGIWLGRHESQGFALEEALSCNIPLLVWNTQYMCQEHGSNYEKIHVLLSPIGMKDVENISTNKRSL